MLSKTIECLSMSLVARKEGGFSLFRLLFEVVSGSFQLVMVSFGSFHFLKATTSQKFLVCKFTINQLHADFITKCFYKFG